MPHCHTSSGPWELQDELATYSWQHALAVSGRDSWQLTIPWYNHCCECSVEECDSGVSRSLAATGFMGGTSYHLPVPPLSFQKSNYIPATWIRTDSRTYNTSQAGQAEDIKQAAGAKRWTHIKPSTISTMKQHRWCLVIIIVITTEIYATLMFKNIFSLFFAVMRKQEEQLG